MNKRKILALAMALSMVAILAVGATLAYFTATDEVENVFTVGNVSIDLIESQYYPQVDGNSLEDVLSDAETYQTNYLAVKGTDMVPGEWVRKAPYVVNTGKNDAFVRVTVKCPPHVDFMLNTTEINKGTFKYELSGNMEQEGETLVFTYLDPIPAATANDTTDMTQVAPVWQFRVCEHVTGDVSGKIVITAEAIQAEGLFNGTAPNQTPVTDGVEAFKIYDAEKAKK